MYGLHLTETLRGQVFSQAVTPLGLKIPIYTATDICAATICGLPLWNRPASGRLVELISLDLNYGSGTADFGAIGLMGLPLGVVGAGSLCTAFAETVPMNGHLGRGSTSVCQSSNGAGTVTVTAGTAGAPSSSAPGWIRSLASFNLEAVTGTAHGTSVVHYDFKGTVIVPESYMIYFAATKLTVALYAATLTWKEIQLNQNAA